jgi:hypothetical protein
MSGPRAFSQITLLVASIPLGACVADLGGRGYGANGYGPGGYGPSGYGYGPTMGMAPTTVYYERPRPVVYYQPAPPPRTVYVPAPPPPVIYTPLPRRPIDTPQPPREVSCPAGQAVSGGKCYKTNQ